MPRLWIEAEKPFVSLCEESARWAEHLPLSWERAGRPFEMELLDSAIRAIHDLRESQGQQVLVNQDLHGGNVLRAKREPWLVIDPKPFIGDPAYDATQHLFNCDARLRADPDGVIRRFADLLGADHERVRLWAFARAAAEPRDDWSVDSMALARAIAP